MTEVLVLGGGGIERRKWVVPARESEHGTTLFMSLSESLNACQGVMGKRGTRPRNGQMRGHAVQATWRRGVVWSGCARAPGWGATPSTAGQRDAGLGVQGDGRIRDKLNPSRWGHSGHEAHVRLGRPGLGDLAVLLVGDYPVRDSDG